jgi:hypothetical protein
MDRIDSATLDQLPGADPPRSTFYKRDELTTDLVCCDVARRRANLVLPRRVREGWSGSFGIWSNCPASGRLVRGRRQPAFEAGHGGIARSGATEAGEPIVTLC